MDTLIGRNEEIREINELYDSGRAEITSKGVKANMYSGIVQYEITLNDLMKP